MCPTLVRSPWAVKKVNRRHALSQFGQRLEDEAKILRSLSHPNIIGFRGFNKKEDGTHALVMEDGHKSLLDIIDVRILFSECFQWEFKKRILK